MKLNLIDYTRKKKNKKKLISSFRKQKKKSDESFYNISIVSINDENLSSNDFYNDFDVKSDLNYNKKSNFLEIPYKHKFPSNLDFRNDLTKRSSHYLIFLI